jgi:hypothetical protein
VREALEISFGDLAQHMYVLGPTQCGKTTFMANLALQLHRASVSGEWPCSVVWVDPKGLDCSKFFGVVDDLEHLTYLDPTLGFAVNPLALPPAPRMEKERLVSLYVSNLLNLLNEWFQKEGKTFTSYAPRASHLVEVVLRALYGKSDHPTLADLYFVCSRLRKATSSELGRLRAVLGAREDLGRVVEDVSKYEPEAWDPILTRFGKFAMDPYLRRIFCPEKQNFDLFSCLEPGHFTILNAAEQKLGGESANLIMSAFIVSLWFAALIRSELQAERSPVVLFVDEFHRVSELGIIGPLLSMASAFGLYLVLAHQSISQLPRDLRQLVLTNTGIQVVGRIGGEDAREVASFWAPGDRELQSGLAGLARFEFKVRDATGAPQIYTVRSLPWPPLVRSEREIQNWLQTQRRFAEPAPLLVGEAAEVSWRDLLPVPLFRETEWRILNLFLEKSWTKETLRKGLGVPPEEFDRAFNYLFSAGYLGIRARTKTSVAYCLLKKGLKAMNAASDFGKIGGKEAVELATRYWRRHRFERFLTVSLQPHSGGPAPDLVEYDYKAKQAVAVEIETESELRAHPDQVRKNAEKNARYGFDRTKLVVKSGFAGLLRKALGDLAEKVEVEEVEVEG